MNRSHVLFSALLALLTGCAAEPDAPSPGEATGKTHAVQRGGGATLQQPEINLDEIDLDAVDSSEDDPEEAPGQGGDADDEPVLGKLDRGEAGRLSLVFQEGHEPTTFTLGLGDEERRFAIAPRDGRAVVDLSLSDLGHLLGREAVLAGDFGSTIAALELVPTADADSFHVFDVSRSETEGMLEIRGYASASVRRLGLYVDADRYEVRPLPLEKGQADWEFVFTVPAAPFLEAWTHGAPISVSSLGGELEPRSVPLALEGRLMEQFEDCGL